MNASQLDSIDIQILRLMQQHGKLANQELAQLVGLSASPCSRRVKAMEESGIIAGYSTILNPQAFKLNLTAYVQVKLEKHAQSILEAFEREMLSYDEVLECCLLTGSDADYQLKVLVVDMEAYKRFLLEKLTTNHDIAGVHSSFVLKQVKSHSAIPLP
ncbi:MULTISPECIES: Lrp/AsnC family transcriptional regulator [Shewanella]|uniref:Lrp/AsnC family transcriptional regulator n=1 Tax=Shewanella TaxID=22 RepID=UPI00048AEC1F|nr:MULTISPECIES: Lrp/AsnC family transcriptional regulator [Shewanella]QLE83999.1 Lrp/AsnC family transcriptional regulator [Shewanella sp. Scap07]